MIELPRSAAKAFAAMLRRVAPGRHPEPSPVAVRQDREGLRLFATRGGVGVELTLAGRFATDALLAPIDALDDAGGPGDESAFLSEDEGRVVVRWTDGGVPRIQTRPAADKAKAPDLPSPPSRTLRYGPGLLDALAQAVRTAADVGARYALHCLRLDAAAGEVQATDGHQLLSQGGFAFPWEGAKLVVRSPLLLSKDLAKAAEGGVELGEADGHFVLTVGPWTLRLPVEKEGKFPSFGDVIPNGRHHTLVRIAERDALALAKALPSLPGARGDCSPVTIEANGVVLARAKGEDGPATELVLPGSSTEGPAVAFGSNRKLLGRALAMGFREIEVRDPRRAVVCREGRRVYLWQPLTNGVAPPDPAAVRAELPPAGGGETQAVGRPARRVHPEHEGNANAMKDTYGGGRLPNGNGHANGNGHTGNGHAANGHTGDGAAEGTEETLDPIEAAEALRGVLRDALARTNDVIAALKAGRKTAKLVRTTLASLRQLDVG